MAAGRHRWIKRSLKALLAVLLIIAGLAVWLLGSQSGARWALGQARERVEGLAVSDVQGSLWSGVILSGVRWDSETVTVSLESLQLKARLTGLLSSTLMIETLMASGLEVVTIAADDEPASDSAIEGIELPAIELPLRIVVKQFELRDLSLSQRSDSLLAGQVDSAPASQALVIDEISGGIEAGANDYQALAINELLIRNAQGEVRLSGQVNVLSWTMDLRHDSRLTGSDHSLTASGTVTGSPADLSIETTATINGPTLALDGSVRARANLERANIDLAVMIDQARYQDPSMVGLELGSLELTLDGNAQQLAWTIQGMGQLRSGSSVLARTSTAEDATDRSTSLRVLPWTLDASGDLAIPQSVLDVAQIRLETPIGVLDGAMKSSLGDLLHVELESRLTGLDTGQLIELGGGSAELTDINDRSSGQLDASIKGQLDWMLASDGLWFERLNLALSEMTLSGNINGLPVNLEAVVTLDQARLELQTLSLSYADNSVQASGWGDARSLELATQLNVVDLSQLSSDLSGSLFASVASSGSLVQPLSRFELNGTDLEFGSNRLADLQASGLIHLDLEEQALLDSQLTMSAGSVSLDQMQIDEFVVDFKGTSLAHSMTALAVLPSEQLSVSVEGGYEQAAWTGRINDLSLEGAEPVGRWQLDDPVSLMLSATRVELQSSCLTSVSHQGSLCVTLSPSAANQAATISSTESIDATGLIEHELVYQASGFTLASLKELMPPQLQLDGLLDADGTATLDQTGVLSVGIQLNTRDANLSIYQPDEDTLESMLDLTLKLDYAGDQLDSRIELSLGDLGRLDGSLTSQPSDLQRSPLSGSFRLRVDDAQYLAALSDEISQVTGQLMADLTVSGQLDAPVMALALSLNEGRVDLARTGTSLTEMDLQAGLDEQGAVNLKLLTTSGGGQIRVDGQGQFKGLDQWTLDATIKGEAVELIRQPEIQLSASPDVRLTANPAQLSLTGRVGIPSASIAFEQLPESAVSLSSDVVVHRPETVTDSDGGMQLSYDLQVDLEAPVAFNAVGLNTRITGDLRLRSRADGTLWSTGALTLVDGVYRIYGQALTISEGRLMFNGPISNPSLDVKATREASNSSDLAGIQLGGTVSSLSSSLYSVPAMPDLDVLSILLTGRRGGSGGELSSDDLARAVILLGLKDSTNLLSQFREALGIDVLNVRGAKQQEDTALEAGKYINEDLYVGYALGIFNRTGVLLLRYQINKRLSLESEYGERQSFDLIYSIEKKR